jgi:hypothetical protein
MAELVIAPLFKPFEYRMKAQLRMALDLPVNGDIACIPNFLRQVGCVKDVFWLEEGVLLFPREKAKVDADAEVLQPLIDESGVAALVARHISEQLLHVRVVDLLLQLRV